MKKKLSIVPWWTLVVATLAACGGGGGGGSSGGSSGDTQYTPVTYQGSTSQATINSEATAKSLINAVIGSTTSVTPLAASVGPTDAASVGSFPVIQALMDYVRSETHLQRIRTARSAREVVNDTEACARSGSVSISGTLNDATGTGDLTFTFNACDDVDVRLDGRFVLRISAVSGDDVTQALVDVVYVRVGKPLFDASLSGSISFSSSGSTDTLTVNAVTRDNQSSRYTRLDNLALSVTHGIPYSTSMRVVITGGRVYDSVLGHVDVSTSTFLNYTNAYQDYPDGGGPLILVGGINSGGVGNSRLRATPVSTSQASVEIDADGDGTFATPFIFAWTTRP